MPCIADADERHSSIQSGVSTPSEESIRSVSVCHSERAELITTVTRQEIPSPCTDSLHFYTRV